MLQGQHIDVGATHPEQAAVFGFKVDKKESPLILFQEGSKNSDPNFIPPAWQSPRKEIWNEWKIMAQTIGSLGLIHKAGKGPSIDLILRTKQTTGQTKTRQNYLSASEIYVDMDGVLVPS